MPPPPPAAAAAAFYSFFLLFSSALPAASRTCSPPSISSCPPFAEASSRFPIGLTPGCGHPSFQVRCATPHSLIAIGHLSFAVLRYNPNTTSLLLSPLPPPHNCSSSVHSTSIPGRPIDLSGSPFRISAASCSRLSLLRSCDLSHSNLPNCTHCPWECKLSKTPIQLLQGCGERRGGEQGSDPTTPSVSSQQGCQADVLDYLDNLLKLGIQIDWTDQDPYFVDCRGCESNNGVCGFNSSDPGKRFLCFLPESRFSPTWIHHYRRNRRLVLGSVFAVACVALVALLVLLVQWSSRPLSLAPEEDPAVLFLHRQRSASLLPPVFTYDALESSTNRFDPKRKIGDGGFGSVFLGQLADGRFVAVKHLHRQCYGRAFSAKSFCNEILILSSIDHPNLVKLHGYCSDPRGLLLVYDYVPNGTLADHLHGPWKGSLAWRLRVSIALQTAMAMEYLHFSVAPAVVHRDITSSNIFVEKDMKIKVGDFGLSRLLVETASSGAPSTTSCKFVWTGPQGTPGYLDPDYHRSFRLTEKSDVYSFGVVLLELVSGKKAVDQTRGRREMALADLVVPRIQMGQLRQVVDPLLAEDSDALDCGGGGVGAVAELAFRCVAAEKDDRPDAREVVAELRRIRSRIV